MKSNCVVQKTPLVQGVAVAEILNVEWPHINLYWQDLDVDIAVESIRKHCSGALTDECNYSSMELIKD